MLLTLFLSLLLGLKRVAHSWGLWLACTGWWRAPNPLRVFAVVHSDSKQTRSPEHECPLVLGPFPQLWCCSGNPLVCVQFLLRIPFWCTFICSACRSAESNHRPRISLKPVVNPHSQYCPLLLPTRSRYSPSLMLVIAFSFRVFFHEET